MTFLPRGADGSFPPATVSANWPRDLSGCVALNGENAKPTPQPVVSFQALSPSGLVTRSISVPTQQNLMVKVNDIPKKFTVEDGPANKEVNPPETVKNSTVLTWNAGIRVKK
jgi:hypothetical protein